MSNVLLDYLDLSNGIITGIIISILSGYIVTYYYEKMKVSVKAYATIYDLVHRTNENKNAKINTIDQNKDIYNNDYALDQIYEILKSTPKYSGEVHNKFLINLAMLYLTEYNRTKEKLYLIKAIEILKISADEINRFDYIEYLNILMLLGELQLKLSELENEDENLKKANLTFRQALNLVDRNSNFFKAKGALNQLYNTSVLMPDLLGLSSNKEASFENLSSLINHYLAITEIKIKSRSRS